MKNFTKSCNFKWKLLSEKKLLVAIYWKKSAFSYSREKNSTENITECRWWTAYEKKIRGIENHRTQKHSHAFIYTHVHMYNMYKSNTSQVLICIDSYITIRIRIYSKMQRPKITIFITIFVSNLQFETYMRFHDFNRFVAGYCLIDLVFEIYCLLCLNNLMLFN